ncbi:MAG: glycosyltransferase family 2 protein [Microcoleaceae cyanobacterium]
MNKDIDVSVVIPTYNRINMLKEALTSVFSQDFTGNIEIIVVDDNSSDETSAFVQQQYPDIHLITLEKNIGCPAARNQGIKVAKGRYIAPLDSDDLWETNYLSSQVSTLENQQGFFGVSDIIIDYTMENKQVVKSQKVDLRRFNSPLHALLVTSSFICSPSTIVLKREVFETVGLFDEFFKVGSDREFYTRCYIHGYQPIFTSQPLAIIRKHGNGQLTDFSISKIEARKQSRIICLERFYPLIESRKLEILPINRLYAEIHSTAAREFFREKYYYHWIKSWIEVAKYMSIQYAAFNILRDLFRFTKDYLPQPIMRMIKTLFLSKSLST